MSSAALTQRSFLMRSRIFTRPSIFRQPRLVRLDVLLEVAYGLVDVAGANLAHERKITKQCFIQPFGG